MNSLKHDIVRISFMKLQAVSNPFRLWRSFIYFFYMILSSIQSWLRVCGCYCTSVKAPARIFSFAAPACNGIGFCTARRVDAEATPEPNYTPKVFGEAAEVERGKYIWKGFVVRYHMFVWLNRNESYLLEREGEPSTKPLLIGEWSRNPRFMGKGDPLS